MTDFPTTRGESIAARATEAIVRSPFLSALRLRELDTLGGRLLPSEEVARRSQQVGLSFFEPMREEKLEALIQRKLKEKRRQRIVAAGPQDLGTKALGLFAELATTVIDPLNVASAFIPVVGEARFAALASRFGRTGARAFRGTAEGLVGATVVEPLVLAAATQEQADYTFLESLLNIAFGTVAGGGLHIAGGKLVDIRRSRKTARLSEAITLMDRRNRELALKGAIANVNEGIIPEPNLYLREDAAFKGDVEARVDSPDPREEALRVREQNEAAVVEDVPSKLQAEVERINDPKSTMLADVEGAREADVRAPEIAARKADTVEAEDLLDSAEENLKAAARTFLEEADDELLKTLGLTRNLDELGDLARANQLIAETREQGAAIKALVACMKRV